ncbi:AsmA family protein [Celerinatantimonas diazotrophica]|uniref:Uncharacterized protein involved in outer membrane biogenesis n=1 Tax=Celerinatantimonas diazotrophica TaxID=412034 RepID=A0A4V2PND5_9GAMM|nr:AsmA family protein [Celerinatantimonas diazotrophica]TCK46617.1 uncharacterized protein involved in outer membrane biogenesis [Celerinatantimonas diazotrophica]CAG9296667.1 hypothetical protein CEDIAZO_01821 [Celerinatantimonas diazotrophica]
MRKWMIALVALIAVTCAAILTVVLQINPNDFKSVISQEVKAKTGRTLTIAGNMHWHFWPLTLSASDMSLSDDPDFRDGKLLSIGQMKVAVSPWGLVEKHLELGKIELSQVSVHWLRNAQGQTNIQSLLNDVRRASGTHIVDPSLWQVSTQGIEIHDATLDLTDQLDHQHIQIAPLNISLGSKSADQSRPLDISLHFNDGVHQLQSSLKASVRVTNNWTNWTLIDFTQTTHFHGLFQKQGLEKLTLSGAAHFDSKSKQLVMRPLSFSFNKQPSMDGELDFDGQHIPYNVTFNVTGSALQLPRFETLLNRFGHQHIQGLDLVNAQGQFKLDQLKMGRVTLDHLLSKVLVKKGAIKFQQLTADFYEGNISANTELDLSQNPVTFAVTGDIAGVDANALFQSWCARSPVTGTLRLSTQLEGTLPIQSFHNVKGNVQVNLADGLLRGVDLTSLASSGQSSLKQLSGRAEFTSDQLNLQAIQMQLASGVARHGSGHWNEKADQAMVTLLSGDKFLKRLSVSHELCQPHYLFKN